MTTTTTIQIEAQSLRPDHIVRDPFGVERTVHHAETFESRCQGQLTRVAWVGQPPSQDWVYNPRCPVTIVVEAATDAEFEGL